MNKNSGYIVLISLLIILLTPWPAHGDTAKKPDAIKVELLEAPGRQAIAIMWHSVSGCEGYYIDRRDNGGDFQWLATIENMSDPYYVDNTVEPGDKYQYQVCSYHYHDDERHVSEHDVSDSITPPDLPYPIDDNDENSNTDVISTDTSWGLPVKADRTCRVGLDYGKSYTSFAGTHNGQDILGEMGLPIFAMHAGQARIMFDECSHSDPNASCNCSGGFGNNVLIDHKDGTTARYAHLNDITISDGWIEKGEIIGTMGSTGMSNAFHLHIETRLDGDRVDPRDYMDLPETGEYIE